MDNEKMRLALASVDINLKSHFEALRNENLAVLQNAGVDELAQKFFAEFSFDTDIEIGMFSYEQANCLKKNHDWEDDFQRALQISLLLVGSARNGDIVVLDLKDYQAGLLFHDYFWEKEEDDPRKYLVKMGCSVGEFYFNSVSLADYPIDAYEAAAYMGSEFTGYWNPEDDT